MKGDNAYLPIGVGVDGREPIPLRILPSSHARRTIDHRSNTQFDAKRILIPSFIDYIKKQTKMNPKKFASFTK
jgi:hypothetical protein